MMFLLCLVVLSLPQVHGLQCYSCISFSYNSNCKEVKNCSDIFTMCKTAMFLPNIDDSPEDTKSVYQDDPSEEPKSIYQDCAIDCKNMTEFELRYRVTCCATDLCNTLNRTSAATRVERHYRTLASYAGLISAILQTML